MRNQNIEAIKEVNYYLRAIAPSNAATVLPRISGETEISLLIDHEQLILTVIVPAIGL